MIDWCEVDAIGFSSFLCEGMHHKFTVHSV